MPTALVNCRYCRSTTIEAQFTGNIPFHRSSSIFLPIIVSYARFQDRECLSSFFSMLLRAGQRCVIIQIIHTQTTRLTKLPSVAIRLIFQSHLATSNKSPVRFTDIANLHHITRTQRGYRKVVPYVSTEHSELMFSKASLQANQRHTCKPLTKIKDQ